MWGILIYILIDVIIQLRSRTVNNLHTSCHCWHTKLSKCCRKGTFESKIFLAVVVCQWHLYDILTLQLSLWWHIIMILPLFAIAFVHKAPSAMFASYLQSSSGSVILTNFWTSQSLALINKAPATRISLLPKFYLLIMIKKELNFQLSSPAARPTFIIMFKFKLRHCLVCF